MSDLDNVLPEIDAEHEFKTGGWQPMDTFPKDGTRCDILTTTGAIAKDIHWGLPPIGTQMTYVGSQNILSPWLQQEARLAGWRIKQ